MKRDNHLSQNEENQSWLNLQESGEDEMYFLEAHLGTLIGNLHVAKSLLNNCNYDLKSILFDDAFLKKYLNKHQVKLLKASFNTVNYAYKIKARRVIAHSPEDFHKILFPQFLREDCEIFVVAYINVANEVLDIRRIAEGSGREVYVQTSKIFELLPRGTDKLLLAHNHPSGKLRPSESDKELTELIAGKAKVLNNIQVRDHLIIHKMEYFSFLDNGLMDLINIKF